MAPIIALIVTGKQAFNDFLIFVKTLETWHRDATLVVYTDTATQPSFTAIKTTLKITAMAKLDAYTGLTRSDMEAMSGKHYDSLFKDYTYEKAGAIRCAFENTDAATHGVWFMDSDIVHLAPLPSIPAGKTLALSPHSIRPADERLFGKYNAGYFWMKTPSHLDVWIAAAPKSRFYEQAALEDCADVASGTAELYEFPQTVNFGWWRMYQGIEPPHSIQTKFGFNRADTSVGIRYDGAPLQSIHTHIDDRSTSANGVFNRWFDSATRKFISYPPLRKFRKQIGFD
jgi:hypothetical protein